ncbi:MAG TPA: ATP-binding protein [Clostridiaceae bacterium]|nr:ATP-binding protein [Clostridiaceae bacterium]
MIPYRRRQIETYFIQETHYYPAILLTGPRQVGKSTLLLHLKEEGRTYVSLDDPALRNLARFSPDLFFERFQTPLLIDEIQYAPELLPYIKMIIDTRNENNLFWLTGSRIYPLMRGVQESLAGRIRVLQLDGFSRKESLEQEHYIFPRDLSDMMQETASAFPIAETILRGSMPRVLFQEKIDIAGYYQSYIDSYIARDVREITNVLDTGLFLHFITLLATRTAQELNLASIGKDLGVDSSTVRRWLDVLITSGLVIELPAYSRNLGKRIIKRPKTHFCDVGLAAYLCSLRTVEAFDLSPLRGNLFESWVVSEIFKSYQHNGVNPQLYYYRDSNQREIDLLIERDGKLYPFEIKLNDNPAHAEKNFSVLAPEDSRIPYYGVICPTSTLSPIKEKVWRIPASLI